MARLEHRKSAIADLREYHGPPSSFETHRYRASKTRVDAVMAMLLRMRAEERFALL